MRGLSILLLICAAAIPVASQTSSSKYQPGTILAVKAHSPKADDASVGSRYDISVKVGNTVYVVLYTLPAGTISPEYRKGLDLLVSVQGHTMKFNDMLGRSREVPILSVHSSPTKSTAPLTEN